MNRAFQKLCLREIRTSLGRFFAIVAIVALGVGFLAGLLTTAPTMRGSVDTYYDESNLYDLSVISTLGLDEDDLEALAAVEGVDSVMPFYQKDVTMDTANGDVLAVRINSADFDETASKSDSALDRLTLVEGRFPTSSSECVLLQKGWASVPPSIGDTLTVAAENGDVSDALAVTAFTVVGIVQDASYFSVEQETTTVGSGTLHTILYTTEDAFSYVVYTNAHLTVKGAAALNTFEQDYLDLMDTVSARIEKVGAQRSTQRYKELLSEAQAQLDAAQTTYDAQKLLAQQQLDEAKAQIDEGQQTYDEGVQALADAKVQYAQGVAEYENGVATLAKTKAETEQQLADAQAKITEGEQQLLQAKDQLDSARPLVELVQQIIHMLETRDFSALNKFGDTIDQRYPAAIADPIKALLASLDQSNEKAIAALLNKLHTSYDEQIEEYESGTAAYEQGMLTLSASKSELTAAQITWAAEEAKATVKLEQAQSELTAAQQQITESEQTLADAKATLEQAQIDYEQGKATAQKQLDEGQQALEDAQRQLDDFSKPQWYVFTRSSNVSYKSFADNADKMEAIARVFPAFFFLVAALVALTTMTRMVDEQRIQIGTLKALGYSKARIMSKYVAYAGLATLLGCIFGLLIGLLVLPGVIWTVYGIMYTLPAFHLDIRAAVLLLTSGLALFCTMAATFGACYSALKEQPAALMLPKSPKAGKRILLERIRPLWAHMKFSHKVTARNLFRYKKRLFMTIFGIAGCTALLVTGFGLRDSIGNICDKQFTELQSFDLSVYCSEVSDELRAGIADNANIEQSMAVYLQSMTAADAANTSKARETLTVYLFVPEETERLPDFLALRTRKTHDSVAFDGSGTVITEKMAETLGLGIGDTLALVSSDNRTYSLPISGVVENYVYSYAYVPRELYESVFGERFEPNAMMISACDTSEDARELLGAQMLQYDGVRSLTFSEDVQTTFSNIIQSINAIVVILILSAALLAFVVLYNLTNINITERQRELATLKVLGFYNYETASYIFREITLLSLIGIGVGLLFGIFLHAYVIRTVEIDMVMFGRTIEPLSFILSALMTVAFSLIVDLVMYPKLKKIDMVESLKSVE